MTSGYDICLILGGSFFSHGNIYPFWQNRTANVSHSQKTNQLNCLLGLAAFVHQINPRVVFEVGKTELSLQLRVCP